MQSTVGFDIVCLETGVRVGMYVCPHLSRLLKTGKVGGGADVCSLVGKGSSGGGCGGVVWWWWGRVLWGFFGELCARGLLVEGRVGVERKGFLGE